MKYNTKKATASNSLQFLTVTSWCFKEVYQSALPASHFILNDHHSKPYKNRKPENFHFIDVNVTSYNRKLRGRFPYKVILSNQTEPLFTSWNPNDVNTELSRTIS